MRRFCYFMELKYGCITPVPRMTLVCMVCYDQVLGKTGRGAGVEDQWVNRETGTEKSHDTFVFN